MEIKDYERANELLKSQEKIDQLYHIFSFPYPSIFTPLRKTLFYCDNTEVNFASLDEDTCKELKEAIKEVLSKRRTEINQEIKDL